MGCVAVEEEVAGEGERDMLANVKLNSDRIFYQAWRQRGRGCMEISAATPTTDFDKGGGYRR
jgi:hypothetical protein